MSGIINEGSDATDFVDLQKKILSYMLIKNPTLNKNNTVFNG